MHNRINKVWGVKNSIWIIEAVSFHLGFALFYSKFYEKKILLAYGGKWNMGKPLGKWNNNKISEEKKYSPILHKETWHKNFIAMLIENSKSFSYLLAACNEILTEYKKVEAKTPSTNLTYLYFETFDSFVVAYFNSNIFYSIHLFCIQWVFN